jgi:hypothetical protein
LYYPGDLLLTLLNLDNAYWLENQFERNQVVTLLNDLNDNIIKSELINDDIKEDLKNFIEKFISI